MPDPRLAGPVLTDPRHPRVRQAQRLARRAFRQSSGRFLAEGPQAVREAVRAGLAREVFITTEGLAHDAELRQALVRQVQSGDLRLHHCTDEVLLAVAQTVTPQGIAAVALSPLQSVSAVLSQAPRLVAVLAEVRDPGNAGTVIRVADAAGADGVVLTAGSVDPLNGKAVRASAGSIAHLPVALGEADGGALADVVSLARAGGCQVLATDGEGELDLFEAADNGLLAAPTAWVFGTEAHGLSPTERALADHVVRIPLLGSAESLNLATAAAVTLYASARAHRN